MTVKTITKTGKNQNSTKKKWEKEVSSQLYN